MGLNIDLYRVADMESQPHKFESDGRFDSGKYGGDEEFSVYTSGAWNSLYCPFSYCCDWIFRRPTNFEETRQWIRGNIHEENRKRLLDVVDLMEREPDHWLYFGW